ncbi:MAG: DUF1822 family protein [Symploca sp. SIO2E6]|nr:DUF1822 family protein [Symploca sp. SIO2E6]
MIQILVSFAMLMALHREDTIRLLERIDRGEIEGYVTKASLKQFLDKSEKLRGFKETIEIIRILVDILKQCSNEDKLLKNAQLANDDLDVEAIEQLCAENMNLGAIIAPNPEKFSWTSLPIISVEECLGRLSLEQSLLQYREESNVVNLTEWFKTNLDGGWQPVQELVSPQPRPVFRDTYGRQQERAKLIDLGLELAGNPVVLIITLLEVNEEGASIRAQVYPTGEALTLPPNLKLSVLTETGDVFREVTARSDDEFIKYQFEAQRGDHFGIQVALGEVSFRERFRV